MKLTPIKVKGKGQKTPWRPPGPPRATKRQRDAEEGESAPEEPHRRRFKSKKPAAPIEELPTEILERITFMTRNLNFLRSSLRIGYRFSSTSFFTELLETAFAPTWDMWFGHEKRARFHNGTNEEDLFPGDPEFQSATLACKWANTSLILEAQQKWYRRHGGPGKHPLGTAPSPRPSLPPPHNPGSEVALECAADVVTRFEADWEAFKGSCTNLLTKSDPEPGDVYRPSQRQRRYLELHPATAIPERLLTGPLDWETARTLFWVVRGGGRVSNEHTWTWELTKRGYDCIMALQDKELGLALLLLLKRTHAFRPWPLFLLEQELDRASGEMKQSNPSADTRLWCYASGILEKHILLRHLMTASVASR